MTDDFTRKRYHQARVSEACDSAFPAEAVADSSEPSLAVELAELELLLAQALLETRDLPTASLTGSGVEGSQPPDGEVGRELGWGDSEMPTRQFRLDSDPFLTLSPASWLRAPRPVSQSVMSTVEAPTILAAELAEAPSANTHAPLAASAAPRVSARGLGGALTLAGVAHLAVWAVVSLGGSGESSQAAARSPMVALPPAPTVVAADPPPINVEGAPAPEVSSADEDRPSRPEPAPQPEAPHAPAMALPAAVPVVGEPEPATTAPPAVAAPAVRAPRSKKRRARSVRRRAAAAREFDFGI